MIILIHGHFDVGMAHHLGDSCQISSIAEEGCAEKMPDVIHYYPFDPGQITGCFECLLDAFDSLAPKINDIVQEKRLLQEEELEAKKAASITFSEFWEKQYWPAQSHKAAGSLTAEQGLYENWLAPEIGSLPLASIAPGALTPIKNNMLEAKKAPSTIKYAMALFSQVWNTAKK